MVVNNSDDPPPPDDDNVSVQISPGGSRAVVAFTDQGTETGLMKNGNDNVNMDNITAQDENQDKNNSHETEIQRLEEIAIKNSRMNSMGERIKSAEPYNYWQDFSIKPAGYMKRVVGVHFKNTWATLTPEAIAELINKDLGIDDPTKALTSMGINGRRIT